MPDRIKELEEQILKKQRELEVLIAEKEEVMSTEGFEEEEDEDEVIQGGYYGSNGWRGRGGIEEFRYKFKVPKDSRWMKLYENEKFREIIEYNMGMEPHHSFCENFRDIKEICCEFREDTIKEYFGEKLTKKERAKLEKQFDAYYAELFRRAEELHPYELFFAEMSARRRVTPEGGRI